MRAKAREPHIERRANGAERREEDYWEGKSNLIIIQINLYTSYHGKPRARHVIPILSSLWSTKLQLDFTYQGKLVIILQFYLPQFREEFGIT